MNLSHADHSHSPPHITISRAYNAAHDLLARNTGRAEKIAYVDAASGDTLTFGALNCQAHQFAAAIRQMGLPAECRVMLAMHDTLGWPVVFLGCILAGVVPVAVNTLLNAKDFEFMLRDSKAQALVLSSPLLATLGPLLKTAAQTLPALRHVIVDGGDGADADELLGGYFSGSKTSLPHILKASEATNSIANSATILTPLVASTCADDACFWLYSSGSTGTPKGTVHLHSHLIQTAELYGQGVLGIRESDVVYSAAKLFFAYGLGNALTFPMSVGATTVLLPARPTSSDVFRILQDFQPTIFYGVPTLYAGLLADPLRPSRDKLKLRLCTSAGEALPADIGRRWTAAYGCEILDGIGSTEMLHIFLSNRPGQVRYGTTGQAVPGYRLKIIGDDGAECAAGEIGELLISGPTSALMYWNQRERTKTTFAGEWTKSGDKYTMDADGYFTYGGRSDDMLKVGGIYVSPFEVEACLMTHPAVLEVAVVGHSDSDELVKPKAWVVLKTGESATAQDLQAHVKAQLAPYKYPRWIEFVAELPKTATGKIQRFRLRA